MKRSELLVAVSLVPLDFLALLAAAWSAYNLRRLEIVTEIRPILYDLSPVVYLQNAAIVVVLWLLIFAVIGLYRRRSTDGMLAEFGSIFFACSLGFLGITVLVFLRGELFSSRFIILAAWAIAIIYVFAVRSLVRQLQNSLFVRGFGAHRVVVVGQGHIANMLVERIKTQPHLGYRIFAVVTPDEQGLSLVKSYGVDEFDEMLVIDAGSSVAMRQQFLELAEEQHVIFRYAPDVLHSPLGAPVVDFDLGVPVIEVPETTLVGWGRVEKRLIDIVGSILAMIVLSPVFLVVALVVWWDSGSPVIYKSERIGRQGRFPFYKFRSMKVEYSVGSAYGGAQALAYEQQLIAEKNVRQGPVPKIVDDPRWTRVGKFLRRSSLDELPQLWSVLIGDMSLVGPRPHLPSEVAHYEHHHKKVLAIKPGMTGLAQVSGRSDLDFDDEVRLDRYYIEHWSTWLDLRILLKTIYVIFQKRKTI